MSLQADISRSRLSSKVGSVQQVLVDQVDGDHAIARSTADAPEIDGLVHIQGAESLQAGAFDNVRITASDDHDLTAELAD